MQAWVVIYAIGAAQAALLALALWRRTANAPANRMLAAWLAIVGLDLAVKAAWLGTAHAAWSGPYRFVGLFPFLYGSLFYLYVRALTTGRGFAARDAMHLAGFGGALVLLAAGIRNGWLWDVFLFGYSLSYVLAAQVRLLRHRRWLRQRRSDADRWSLRWIEAMALAQLAIWCIAATHVLVDWPWFDYFAIYGAVAAWVCIIGWFSLGQPPVAEAVQDDTQATPGQDQEQAQPDDPRFPDVEAKLHGLMREHALYREPALTIGQVARRSGYPEYLVSAVINRRLGGNFWEWINRQRVDAVAEKLADPGDSRTVLEIAWDCGFTAKSTFNAAFKRRTGETPSAWRQRHARGRGAAGLRTPPG